MKAGILLGTTESGRDFVLPLDLVTQTVAILAKKGSGKSYTAAVLGEGMLELQQQLVIVDPTGAHWGLRSSADGKRAGFSIVVIGGDHADIPLEPGAGEVIAKAIVEHRFSAIIDTSLLRKGQMVRFLGEFFETLYRINREPLHLLVDEADTVAPQKPFGDEARTLGAMEDIVRRGRIRGIGCTLITQRPAVINKNVLTQCEVLVALRLSHPRDIATIMEWVNVHAEAAPAAAMLKSLPSLPIGTAWLWSPGWGDFFERIKVRKRDTFDSGATPKAGGKPAKAAVLAAVDIARLGTEISKTVDEAKANAPAALKARIAELEAELETLKLITLDTSVLEEARQQGYKNAIWAVRETLPGIVQNIHDFLNTLDVKCRQIESDLVPRTSGQWKEALGIPITPTEVRTSRAQPAPAPRSAALRPTSSAAGMTPAKQRILDALAWWKAAGETAPTRAQVAYVSEISPKSSSFANNLGALRTSGLIEYPEGNCVCLTAEGFNVANEVEGKVSRNAFLQRVRGVIREPAKVRIFDALVGVGSGRSITREALAEAVDISPSSSSYANNLGALRTLGILDYPIPGQVGLGSMFDSI